MTRPAQADQRQVRDRGGPADFPGCLPQAPMHSAGGWLLRVEGDQGAESKTALRHCHEGRRAVRPCWHLGELERAGLRRMDSDLRDHTTDANELVADIHDRMPVILAPADYARWLGEEPDPRDLMRPFPSELMRIWPISTRVNKPDHDDPSIIEPIQLTTDAA